MPGTIFYPDGPMKFVEGFYSPLSEIAARLKKAEKDGVQWDPEQAEAIKRFRECLEAESESQRPASEDPRPA